MDVLHYNGEALEEMWFINVSFLFTKSLASIVGFL